MRQKLRVRVGAVVLALATLAAIVFSWYNFLQRARYDLVDDGVAWSDGPSGDGSLEGSTGFTGIRGRNSFRRHVCWR